MAEEDLAADRWGGEGAKAAVLPMQEGERGVFEVAIEGDGEAGRLTRVVGEDANRPGAERDDVAIERQKFARADATRNVSGSTKGYNTYVAGKYSLPLGERISAYGKLGLAHSERKYDNSWGDYLNDTDTGAYAALGAQYQLTEKIAVSAEYERYGCDKPSGAKADVWTVGAKYSF